MARFIDDLSGAHHRTTSGLRKLFPAFADRRSRNGFPGHESFFVLGYCCFARWNDLRFPSSSRRGHHPLDCQRCVVLPRSPSHGPQFQRHYARPSCPRHDFATLAADSLGLVHQCDSQPPYFQHSSGCLRISPFGPATRVTVLLAPDFSFAPAGAARAIHSSVSVAAPFLVLCAGRCLRCHTPVLRNCLAHALQLLPQARVVRASRGPRPLRSWSLWLLHLGPAHVFKRAQSVVPARFLAAGLLSGLARMCSCACLVRYSVEGENPTQYGHALCAWLYIPISGGGRFRSFPRTQRPCFRSHQQRFRHRPFSPGYGRGSHVCDSQRSLLLVSKNIRAPSQ